MRSHTQQVQVHEVIASALLAAVLALLPGDARAADTPAPAGVQVVDVLVTVQSCDERMPWRLSRPQFRQGYGVVVAPGRVLTTEELVRQAALIELRQPGRAVKYAATLRQSDPQVAAALLEVSDAAFRRELEPVTLASNLVRGAQTRIVQYDDSGLRQEGAGRIVEIGVEPLPAAPSALLTFRVLSDLRVQNPGAPVYTDGQLAGVMMRYDAQHQTGFVLPAPVIARFLQAAAEPRYLPPPDGGFAWVPLVDAAKRRYFGLGDEKGGVQVVEVATNASASGVLEPNDVLLQWDGFAVDNQGFYADPEYGRLRLSHAIEGRRRTGERVAVTFVRQGAHRQAEITLRPHTDADALVPENTVGAPPEYLVEGGFVLRELTARYLRTGGRGVAGANLRLSHLYLARGERPDQAGDRVVILAGVLPDPVNVGYQELHDEVVTAVNGEAVHNLRDVARILDRDNGIQRLAFQGRGIDVVLDTAQRSAVNARVGRTYRIPELRRVAGEAKP
jgi:S1-C subfamily serine protease